MRKIFALLLLLPFLQSQAKKIPPVPSPPRLVNDYAKVLSSGERQDLEQKLTAYFDTTSTQIAIVIESSLEGDDLFDYCQRLAEGWGIGEKGKDNGVLVYVAISDHKIRIHSGYGMEGVLPDAICKRIIDHSIKPNFKQGAYYQGLNEATDDIIAAAKGEYTNSRKRGNGKEYSILIIIIIVVVVLIFISPRGGKGGGRSGLAGPFFWGTFGSGGFSSGGGGWGSGGGGGGFGGFGGGSFGGGGSSGSW